MNNYQITFAKYLASQRLESPAWFISVKPVHIRSAHTDRSLHSGNGSVDMKATHVYSHMKAVLFVLSFLSEN